MQKVEIKCKGSTELPLSKLNEFQGDLKELTPVNYEKFKAELLHLGFSEPISVWKNKEKYYILNGHQR